MNNLYDDIFILSVFALISFILYYLYFLKFYNIEQMVDLVDSTIDVKTLGTNKPILWFYWENIVGRKKPEYIDLCIDTIYKHCSKDFQIIHLDNKNIYDYLPNLRKDINNLKLAQKTDYIRLALLYYYGGIWIDADTIVMRSLIDIVHKIKEGYDYIGFGCSKNICMDGYPYPSNWLMAAPKGSTLIKCTLADVNNLLDNLFSSRKKELDYFEIGKIALWRNIDRLMSKGYAYYHYSSEYDASRDKDGIWVNVDNHISKEKTILLNEDKLFVVPLENNKFMGDNPKYNWFSDLSKSDIINGDYWISYLFRKSLS